MARSFNRLLQFLFKTQTLGNVEKNWGYALNVLLFSRWHSVRKSNCCPIVSFQMDYMYSELFPTTQKFKSLALKTLCFWLVLNMLIQICSKSDSNIWLQRVGNVCLDIRYPLWVREHPQNWPNYSLAIKGRVQKTKLAKTFNMSNIQESEAFLNKRTIHT